MHGPDALLLVSPACNYCKGMRQFLTEFANSNALASLAVVDISEQPEIAEQLGVRSVPWLLLGEFVFEGAHTPGEISKWIDVSKQENGWPDYLAHLLATGQLSLAERLVQDKPERVVALIELARNAQTEMNIRIGIAAILESQQGLQAVHELIPLLADMAESEQATIRADACHFLALTGSAEAIPVLRKCINDTDPSVREIASEGIAELQADPGD